MFGSVLPACDMTGVSTSSTPRWAKISRTAALRRARRRSASNVADGCQSLIGSDPGQTVLGIHPRSSVLGEEIQPPGLLHISEALRVGTECVSTCSYRWTTLP